MAWVPFAQSSLYSARIEEWSYEGSEYFDEQTSTIHLVGEGSGDGGTVGVGYGWMFAQNSMPTKVRVTCILLDYEGDSTGEWGYAAFAYNGPPDDPTDGYVDVWAVGQVIETTLVSKDGIRDGYMEFWANYQMSRQNFIFLIEVWEDGPVPPPDGGFRVYELDKGWSFDGAYIPHYLEMNWYFGDDPIHYHSIQKIRVHGMSKGIAQLTVATNGMQTDYERDFSEPQILDLPRNPKHISTELVPETNYTDSANRGLSIQMKFEGRNRDLTRPEPQHVLQVLSVQSSPAGTGFRSN